MSLAADYPSSSRSGSLSLVWIGTGFLLSSASFRLQIFAIWTRLKRFVCIRQTLFNHGLGLKDSSCVISYFLLIFNACLKINGMDRE
jgi:hypothetical protein